MWKSEHLHLHFWVSPSGVCACLHVCVSGMTLSAQLRAPWNDTLISCNPCLVFSHLLGGKVVLWLDGHLFKYRLYLLSSNRLFRSNQAGSVYFFPFFLSLFFFFKFVHICEFDVNCAHEEKMRVFCFDLFFLNKPRSFRINNVCSLHKNSMWYLCCLFLALFSNSFKIVPCWHFS